MHCGRSSYQGVGVGVHVGDFGLFAGRYLSRGRLMNRAKAKGTWAETQVVRLFQDYGWKAERKALAGRFDQGDIWVADGSFIIEVKNYADAASWAKLRAWQEEAAVEAMRGPRGAMPLLVVKRPGSGKAADWWLWWPSDGLWVGCRLGDWLDNIAEQRSVGSLG